MYVCLNIPTYIDIYIYIYIYVCICICVYNFRESWQGPGNLFDDIVTAYIWKLKKKCQFVFNSEICIQRTVLAVFFKRCIFRYIIY